MKKTLAAIITVGIVLAGCATLAPGPTPTATSVQVAAEPTATALPTSTPAPSATPTTSPANDGCVRATTEIPDALNPTQFITSGPATGCYNSIAAFLGDVGLAWEQFVPGATITFWTQWPVDADGHVVYPTPTPTSIPPTPTPVPPPHLVPGRVVLREADGTIAYNWFTYVPPGLRREELAHVLITGVHGNIHSPNYQEITDESEKLLSWRVDWARDRQLVLLVPVIPKYFEYQPVVFDLTCFDPSTDPFYQRPDQKVNLMVDTLLADLRAAGYTVSDKVLVEGFSSGGMFAQRYALLHPERVQAVAAGHCGAIFTMPESTYEGAQIGWPVGIADLPQLVGHQFDRGAYMRIHQFIYIGDQDPNTTFSLSHSATLWQSQEQIDFVLNTFGDTGPAVLETQIRYLNAIGYENITLKVYAGVSHELTPQMVNDLLSFLDAHS